MIRTRGMAAAILLLLVVAAGGCGPGPVKESSGSADVAGILKAYPELAGREVERAAVRRIVDGDTFETEGGDTVRLVGINTPETRGTVEAYGLEASAYTAERLKGQRVILIRDVSETDRYGRLLRFVFVEGETEMLNERLLKDGYARVMTYPPDVTLAERFLRSERQARERRRGLWADEPASAGQACADPAVKGNINGKGDKIYHRPGDPQYERTKPELLFCSAEEAEAAGFRKPK